jgi:hypothetical protein
MNTINIANNGFSARLFAGITMLSLLLSAFPVAFFVAQAATNTIHTTASFALVANALSATGNIDATGKESLTLSFDYDATGGSNSDDGLEAADTFRYGYRFGANPATEFELGFITGEPNAGSNEIGSVTNLVIPAVVNNTADLQFYFKVVSGGGTDNVAVTNIVVKADDAVVIACVGQIEEGLLTGPVQNTNSGDFFSNVQNAINDCDTTDGNTIVMSANETTTSQITINKEITLDGGGFTIDANFAKPCPTCNDNNSAVGVSADNVTIKNIKVTSSGDKSFPEQLHGINVYESTGVLLTDITASDFAGTGIVVNSSEVTAKNIKTNNNGWHAINVDQRTSQKSKLIIKATSVHGETSPTPQIWVDSVEKDSEVEDFDSQYDREEVVYKDGQGNDLTGAKYTLKQPATAPEVVNVYAAKIVCTDEADLPNGNIIRPISSTTAALWVSNHSSCSLVDGWKFEWAPKTANNPGDSLVGTAGSPWKTFVGSTQIPVSEITGNTFWMREVLKDGYIPFTYQAEGKKNTDDYTAEFYCHTDAKNFDNYDRIDNPQVDGSYYCVAWNSPVDPDPKDENQFTFTGYKFNNLNGDRDQDVGEEKLYGWEFNMYKEVEGVWAFVASTSVNSAEVPKNAGKFVFPQQQEAGVYHVCEVMQYGWTQVRQDWSGTPYHIVTENLSPNTSIEGPYCATATYTDEEDRSKASYFGNLLTPEVVDYSTVTMCKYDEQQNPLSGWQLALVGERVDSLAFAPTAAVQSMTAVPAGDYVLKAEGTYNYGNGNRFADARFSERKLGESNYAGPYVPWVEASVASQGLAVKVDGDSTVWGSVFSPSHVYYSSLSQAALSDIGFSMFDDQYADNIGKINLTLNKGFTGVTGGNGCVTFKNVPYGSYNVEELLQTGFENTSGLGEFNVNEKIEKVTVVNKDLAYIAPCELTAYSDAGTVVVENNTYATSTYKHASAWTASIPGATWVWEALQVLNPEVDTVKTFEETFTVATPTSATLDIAADNGYKVFVNGVMIVDRSALENNFQTHTQTTFTTEVLNELVSGENTLRIEVNNMGVEGSNYKGNPAGVLYKLVVNGANDCEITTETQPIPATLAITSPVVGNDIVPRTLFNFTAEYNDNDPIVDNIEWAIRVGTCNAGEGTIAGNVDGFSNASTFAGTNFVATLDTTSWAAGNYCFVVNPNEQSGETDLRATRLFTIAPVDGGPNPDPRYIVNGYKYEVTASATTSVSGWLITASNEVTTATTTTDVDGAYSFMLPAGSWTISEAMPTGWEQSSVSQNGEVVATESLIEKCQFNLASYEQAFRFDSESIEVLDEVSNDTCNFYNKRIVEVVEVIETPENIRRTSSGGGRPRLALAPAGQVLGATTASFCPFLTEHMQIGATNDTMEVMKLQMFLNIFRSMFGGTENPVNGVFGVETDANVKTFQQHFKAEILDPWYNLGIVPHNRPTGFVYKTTLWKINSIVCPETTVVPSLEGEDLSSNIDITRN